jgi:hypothetical protein
VTSLANKSVFALIGSDVFSKKVFPLETMLLETADIVLMVTDFVLMTSSFTGAGDGSKLSSCILLSTASD